MRLPLPLLLGAALLAACNGPAGESTADPTARPASDSTSTGACTPLETRPANAPDQRPAFAGQTRACAAPSNVAHTVTVVASGLEHPWAVEPLPDGSVLVTERPGRLRLVSASGTVGEPITGLPAVVAGGQGGLLDVALSPTFARDRTLYWSFSEPRSGGNATSVGRGVLSADGRRVDSARVIVRTMPAYNNNMHYGSRLAFGPDGKLYVTMGERSDKPMRPQAQQMNSHLGKILRVNPDGTAPADNPFVGQAGALPEIWSTGHRNVQAATFDPQGRLWVVEMGTQGGDEVNLIEKGKNYGWPRQAYGEEYSGQPIPGAQTTVAGTEQPVYYWDPVIAPSGAEVYTGTAFPAWQGSLFTGALREKRLVRLVVENNRVTGEEHLLADRGKRVRDVRQGPDGALYVVTDEDNGELWRISPGR